MSKVTFFNSKKYVVYYKDNLSKEFRYLNVETNTYHSTYHLSPINFKHRFEVFKGYAASDEGLKLFAADFEVWCNELATNYGTKIDYKRYFTHGEAVMNVFKLFANGLFEHFENIDHEEYEWIEKCHNGGLTYCDNTRGPIECYGYDFKNFYPNILVRDDFMIPFAPGQEYSINKLPDKLWHGFYNVKITSEHKNAKKIFAFSPNNVYMHHSIAFAQKHQKKYKFNIELIDKGDDANCYLYKEELLMKAGDIFNNSKTGKKKWFEEMQKLKTKFPKNKLVKHLFSSLHGKITQFNSLKRTPAQVKAEGLIIDLFRNDDTEYMIRQHYVNANNDEYYELMKVSQPYQYNIRMKSWLCSFGRNLTAEIVLTDIKHVVRVQTDGIVFDREQHFENTMLLPEEKTTGLIEWYNVNSNNRIVEKRNKK